jgi:septal ring factor EnvC (AmiA/AmiB activator)
MFVLKYVVLPLIAVVSGMFATFYTSQASQDRETARINEQVVRNEERQKAFEDTTADLKGQMSSLSEQLGKVGSETVRISTTQTGVKEDLAEIKNLILEMRDP